MKMKIILLILMFCSCAKSISHNDSIKYQQKQMLINDKQMIKKMQKTRKKAKKYQMQKNSISKPKKLKIN